MNSFEFQNSRWMESIKENRARHFAHTSSTDGAYIANIFFGEYKFPSEICSTKYDIGNRRGTLEIFQFCQVLRGSVDIFLELKMKGALKFCAVSKPNIGVFSLSNY